VNDWESRIEKKVDRLVDTTTEIRITQAKMEVEVAKNTADLATHIEGVKQNRHRIEKLEEPGKVRQYIAKRWKHISVVLGVILGVLGFLLKYGWIAL